MEELPAVPPHSRPHDDDVTPRIATGFRRWCFVVIGLFFVGVAVVGAITPGLPTTIWVLLASYFFARSSPRLHAWLWHSRLFGALLQDWERHRGMRVRSKIVALIMLSLGCSMSITFATVPDWVRMAIACAGFIGISVIVFFVRTVPREATDGSR